MTQTGLVGETSRTRSGLPATSIRSSARGGVMLGGPQAADQYTLRHYVDKLDAAWTRAAASSARVDMFQFFLAILLLMISYRVVSVGETIKIAGVSLSASHSLVLVAGACLSFLLYVLGTTLAGRMWQLYWEIVGFYRRLGLDIEAHPVSHRNPWATNGMLDVAETKPLSKYRGVWLWIVELNETIFGIATLALPVCGQSVACWASAKAFGGGFAYLLLVIPALSFLELMAADKVADPDERKRWFVSHPTQPDFLRGSGSGGRVGTRRSEGSIRHTALDSDHRPTSRIRRFRDGG